MITLIAALVIGLGSGTGHDLDPNIHSTIGPEPCVFVIPIATPGHWMCPEGVSPPEMTP